MIDVSTRLNIRTTPPKLVKIPTDSVSSPNISMLATTTIKVCGMATSTATTMISSQRRSENPPIPATADCMNSPMIDPGSTTVSQ